MREGWEKKELREVCIIRPPKKEAKDKLSDNELVSFVPMKVLGIEQKYFSPTENKNISSVSSSYTYFQDGDVLLAKITPCFENGKLGIAKELTNGIGFGSSEYIVYRAKEQLCNQFLYYFLNQEGFRDSGKRQMTGAVGHKRIPKEFYEETLIPIPPLQEQKQIVALLDKAFTAIDQAKANIEKNIANAKELFQSKLNDIFSQKGAGWELKKLGNICERVSVGHVGATSKFYTENDGVAFIRSQNVRRGFIDLSNVRYVTKEFHLKLKKSQLKKGDILFVRVGANRGDCATLTEEIGDLNCANIVFARPLKENSKFIEYYFLSPLGTKSLLGLTTGSAQGVINTKSIEQTYINFPSEKEQEMIVKKIEFIKVKMNDIENQYNKKLSSLEDLKKSILQKAFAGELTNQLAVGSNEFAVNIE